MAIGDSMVSMTKCVRNGAFSYGLAEGEMLGVVSPTYFSGLPSVVEDCLSRLEIRSADPDPYVYCIATYGHSSGCASLYEDLYLSDRGFPAAARFTVRMPGNFLPDHDVNDKAGIARINDAADKVIDGIIERISSRAHGDFSNSRMPMFLAKRAHKQYDKARTTDHLSSDEGKCIGCRRCEKFCPEQAIEVDGKTVTWTKDRCVMCFGCVNRCPTNAIQYDGETGSRGQYVHPGVKLSMSV